MHKVQYVEFIHETHSGGQAMLVLSYMWPNNLIAQKIPATFFC